MRQVSSENDALRTTNSTAIATASGAASKRFAADGLSRDPITQNQPCVPLLGPQCKVSMVTFLRRRQFQWIQRKLFVAAIHLPIGIYPCGFSFFSSILPALIIGVMCRPTTGLPRLSCASGLRLPPAQAEGVHQRKRRTLQSQAVHVPQRCQKKKGRIPSPPPHTNTRATT